MADIAPIGRPTPASLGRAGSPASPASSSSPPPSRGRDSVELSTHAQLLSRLAGLPDVRQDLVDQIRAAIADGTYETPEKIESAIDALAEDLT